MNLEKIANDAFVHELEKISYSFRTSDFDNIMREGHRAGNAFAGKIYGGIGGGIGGLLLGGKIERKMYGKLPSQHKQESDKDYNKRSKLYQRLVIELLPAIGGVVGGAKIGGKIPSLIDSGVNKFLTTKKIPVQAKGLIGGVAIGSGLGVSSGLKVSNQYYDENNKEYAKRRNKNILRNAIIGGSIGGPVGYFGAKKIKEFSDILNKPYSGYSESAYKSENIHDPYLRLPFIKTSALNPILKGGLIGAGIGGSLGSISALMKPRKRLKEEKLKNWNKRKDKKLHHYALQNSILPVAIYGGLGVYTGAAFSTEDAKKRMKEATQPLKQMFNEYKRRKAMNPNMEYGIFANAKDKQNAKKIFTTELLKIHPDKFKNPITKNYAHIQTLKFLNLWDNYKKSNQFNKLPDINKKNILKAVLNKIRKVKI